MALAMITASVFGSIGETPRQFEPRKADVSIEHDEGVFMSWRGSSLVHSGFFHKGQAIMEGFAHVDGKRITYPDDVGASLETRVPAHFAAKPSGQHGHHVGH